VFRVNKQTKPRAERDRHGFRGTPPPPLHSLGELPDDSLLTDTEVAGYLRIARSTVAGWRNNPTHPLVWLTLPGGFQRTTAASLRAYMARGVRRRRTDLMTNDAEHDAYADPKRGELAP
jgi:hypothetical protein